jgi:predicted metal-dependent phosphoesterase TrpH
MDQVARGFFLDLHVHTADGSTDASATVDGYLRWIEHRRGLGYCIDGFVITEHRRFDPDRAFGDLAARYGAVVLQGVELETDAGHVLVFGVAGSFFRAVNADDPFLPCAHVFRAALDHGGVAVAAHAGRPRIGVIDHLHSSRAPLRELELIEALNGGSSDSENDRALAFARDRALSMVGGSDAHQVTEIGSCLTRFDRPVTSIEDLVCELRAGYVQALTADSARFAGSERAQTRFD